MVQHQQRDIPSTVPCGEEAPQELANHLTDLARKWNRECLTFDELLDLVVKEQLINCLPEDVRV